MTANKPTIFIFFVFFFSVCSTDYMHASRDLPIANAGDVGDMRKPMQLDKEEGIIQTVLPFLGNGIDKHPDTKEIKKKCNKRQKIKRWVIKATAVVFTVVSAVSFSLFFMNMKKQKDKSGGVTSLIDSSLSLVNGGNGGDSKMTSVKEILTQNICYKKNNMNALNFIRRFSKESKTKGVRDFSKIEFSTGDTVSFPTEMISLSKTMEYMLEDVKLSSDQSIPLSILDPITLKKLLPFIEEISKINNDGKSIYLNESEKNERKLKRLRKIELNFGQHPNRIIKAANFLDFGEGLIRVLIEKYGRCLASGNISEKEFLELSQDMRQKVKIKEYARKYAQGFDDGKISEKKLLGLSLHVIEEIQRQYYLQFERELRGQISEEGKRKLSEDYFLSVSDYIENYNNSNYHKHGFRIKIEPTLVDIFDKNINSLDGIDHLLSNNSDIKKISIWANKRLAGKICVSKNSILKNLDLGGNNYTEIVVSENPELETAVFGANNSLRVANLSGNPKLRIVNFVNTEKLESFSVNAQNMPDFLGIDLNDWVRVVEKRDESIVHFIKLR